MIGLRLHRWPLSRAPGLELRLSMPHCLLFSVTPSDIVPSLDPPLHYSRLVKAASRLVLPELRTGWSSGTTRFCCLGHKDRGVLSGQPGLREGPRGVGGKPPARSAAGGPRADVDAEGAWVLRPRWGRTGDMRPSLVEPSLCLHKLELDASTENRGFYSVITLAQW